MEFCRLYSLSSRSQPEADTLEIGKCILHSFIYYIKKNVLGTNYELSPKTIGTNDLHFVPCEGAQSLTGELI